MTKEVSEESLNEFSELLRERITITVERCDEGWKAVAESGGCRVVCRGERMKEVVWNVCVEMEGCARGRERRMLRERVQKSPCTCRISNSKESLTSLCDFP